MSHDLDKHIRKEILIGSLSNIFFNGLIAWWLLKDKGDLHLWGETGFAVDIAATGFILPLIVGLIVISIHRSKVRKGKMPAVPGQDQQLWGRFPFSVFFSSAIFGLIGLFLIAPITIGVFIGLNIDQVSPINYSIFKGLWAGVIVAILAGPMVKVGLRRANTAEVN
ncbi:MAG: hypothetical protein V7711_12235 [Pseudomonadales bacterium]